MSKTKRLEKHIDYIKSIITMLVALCAGIVAWFVKDDDNNLFFQAMGMVFSYIRLWYYKAHKRIKSLLDELEAVND